jgi:hypothetical protein
MSAVLPFVVANIVGVVVVGGLIVTSKSGSGMPSGTGAAKLYRPFEPNKPLDISHVDDDKVMADLFSHRPPREQNSSQPSPPSIDPSPSDDLELDLGDMLSKNDGEHNRDISKTKGKTKAPKNLKQTLNSIFTGQIAKDFDFLQENYSVYDSILNEVNDMIEQDKLTTAQLIIKDTARLPPKNMLNEMESKLNSFRETNQEQSTDVEDARENITPLSTLFKTIMSLDEWNILENEKPNEKNVIMETLLLAYYVSYDLTRRNLENHTDNTNPSERRWTKTSVILSNLILLTLAESRFYAIVQQKQPTNNDDWTNNGFNRLPRTMDEWIHRLTKDLDAAKRFLKKD